MATEIAVRRSARDRRQVTTYYDEAKQALEERRSLSPAKKARTSGKDKSVNHKMEVEDTDSDEDGHDEENSDNDTSDEEENEEGNDKKVKKIQKSSAPVSKATVSQKTKKPAKVVVQVGKSTLHKNKRDAVKNSRAANSGMHSLAKKVLEKDEKESLIAKLLYSNSSDDTLKRICLDVIQLHRDDANACQVCLINLVFRAVGGSHVSALSDNIVLEEMVSDDWSKVITELVDDMRYCAAEHVLICADPNGAVITPKTATTSVAQAIRDFRAVYQKFWYTLAEVALQDCAGRFEIEMLRNWLSRMHELTLVAQPDIRAAVVLASLQMTLGALQRTVSLQAKESTTGRLLKASSGNKAEAFQYQLDTLQRSRHDLEEIVDSTFSTVFMNRYRDSNPFVRAENIAALSKMTLLRPDIYLRDKYLKYIGWTLSDKEPCVRIASVSALSAPFQQKGINLASMENVIRKFLPRLADCTIDVDITVQEMAMALFLLLDRANFLESFEDDSLWAQINNRALASDTSAVVRRDALQFILDQLEAFDYDETEGVKSKDWVKDKNASLVQSSNMTAAKQLSTLAGWVGHALTDGNIPMEHIRIQLTDYVVDSLRSLPEHQSLVTNWSSMMLAIENCEYVPTSTHDKAEERTEIARERVMVRILSRAAQAEVHAVSPEFLQAGEDPVAFEMVVPLPKTKMKRKGNSHEALSSALLKSLPGLFVKYKTDTHILTSLSSLPRMLVPSVVSLPQRKHDFLELIKIISEVFLHSGNESVLLNIAEALVFLVREDHARANDAKVQLRRVVSLLSEKLMTLMLEHEDNQSRGRKRKNVTDSSDANDEIGSNNQGMEVAISMCLRRLRILSKRVDISTLMDDSKEDDKMRKLRDAVVKRLSDHLEARQIILSDDSVDATVMVPAVWKDSNVHEALAASIQDSLHFLLASFAWSLRDAIANDPIASSDVDAVHHLEEVNEEIEEHPIIQQRNQLVDFLALCFEQFLPETNEDLYTEEHIRFADDVQTAAFQTSGDLRALLPKVWADASSPLLRACALIDDSNILGGGIRYFRSREQKLREVEGQESENIQRVCDLLLPFCRTFAANWRHSNRREAGYAMSHIVGSGQSSQQILTALSRIVKKVDPVHLLETHMACLRTSFDDWLNSEPEDIESDRPTDEEMTAYAVAENEHREMFDLLVQLAGRLSHSLGVGKVDAILEKPLLGFCREGIRFAFSTDVPGDEEPLLPGGRLAFLSLISKYIPWVRRNSAFSEVIVQNVIDREEELQNDPDFDQAHQDDLDALSEFRKTIRVKMDVGTPSKSPRSVASVSQVSEGDESETDDDGKSPGTSDAFKGKRPRLSRGSSIGSSVRSMSANVSALSPLIEEGDDSGEDSPKRERRKRKHTKLHELSNTGDSDDDDGIDLDTRKFGRGIRRSSVGSALSGPIQEEDDSNVSSE